ncbi:MAG: DHH family phosphoesterase, partial [Candidatus Limnocylindrales bacterium]
LAGRGIDSVAAIDDYLGPALAGLHDPARLPDGERLLGRLVQARDLGQSVLVFGDFDADGLTGLAIMVRALRRFGLVAEPYVPSRQDEGHGLSQQAVERAGAVGHRLIITVDTGSSSLAEVAGLQQASHEAVRIGQPGGVVQPGQGRTEVVVDRRDRVDPPAGQNLDDAGGHAQLPCSRDDQGVKRERRGEVPGEAGLEHRPSVRASGSSGLHYVCTGRPVEAVRDAPTGRSGGPPGQEAERRTGRAAAVRPRFLSSQFCHTTSKGLALKIDE